MDRLNAPFTWRRYLLFTLFRIGLGVAAGMTLFYVTPPTVAVVLVGLAGIYFGALLIVLNWPPWQRKGCTICGRRPALPAPTKPVTHPRWYWPVQHDQVYEYVCVDHLETWLRMRVVMEEERR